MENMRRTVVKRLLLAILLSSFFCSPAFCAIASTTVWEVRTTGNTANGSGFNASNASVGTDYSQQDAAQDSGTDLASADGDAVPCVVTSATHNFVAADNGNLIQITEAGDGFTLGFYEIVSTATNAATLDRACGSDGAKTGGDWAYGGASDHPDRFSAIVTAGNKTYIEGGTYQPVGGNAFVLETTVVANDPNRFDWIGYKASTAREDAYLDDRPLLDANSQTNAILVSQSGQIFKNLRVTGATNIGLNGSSKSLVADNIKAYSNGSHGIYCNSNGSSVIRSEVTLNTGNGISGSSSANVYAYNYSHDNTVYGFYSGYNFKNISESNTGSGYRGQYTNANWIGCIAYGHSGSGDDGFDINGWSGGDDVGNLMMDNVAVDNAGIGYRMGSSGHMQPYFVNNAYEGNGTPLLYITPDSDTDVTDDPLFTAPAADPPDFTLGTTSPLIGVGTQGASWAVRVGLADVDYNQNIGVSQAGAASAGGSGTTSYGFSN